MLRGDEFQICVVVIVKRKARESNDRLCFYHPRMRRGNMFGRVCLSILFGLQFLNAFTNRLHFSTQTSS